MRSRNLLSLLLFAMAWVAGMTVHAQSVLSLDAEQYTVGDPITVIVAGADQLGGKDWVGIYEASKTPSGDNPSYAWMYVNGQSQLVFEGADGEAKTVQTPGDYYVVLLKNDGYDEGSDRVPFTVVAAASAWDEPALVDDVYQIGTASELEWFAEFVNKGGANLNAKAVLTADIDLQGIEHTPIGLGLNDASLKFDGVFDGQHHRIKNMVINDETGNNVGFFGFVRGTAKIYNVIIDKSCSVTGKGRAGGLIGAIQQTGKAANPLMILNCVNEADVTSTGAVAGGIIGAGASPYTYFEMHNCVNTGRITGASNNYGVPFCGWDADGGGNSQVWHCYTIGEASPQHTSGSGSGLLFRGSFRSVIGSYDFTNDYSKGGFQAEKIEWQTADPVASGELCWYLNNYKNDSNPSKGVSFKQTIGVDPYPLPVAEGDIVYQNATYGCDGRPIEGSPVTYSNSNESAIPDHDFDEMGICRVCGGYEEPALVDGYYELSKAGHVEWFSARVAKGGDANMQINGRLVSDIDFGNIENLHSPIGPDTGAKYNGTFDGQGFRIKNMIINRPDADNQAFFGFLRGNAKATTVCNLIIDASCSITGRNNVGAIAANGQNSEIAITLENCVNEAAVTAVGENAGAIVASSTGNDPIWHVKNCLNTGTITASNWVAAISGWFGGNGNSRIEGCLNLGDIVCAGNNDYARQMARIANADNFVNSFDLTNTHEAAQGKFEGKTADPVTSGELCFALNGDQSTIAWHQTLGQDAYPSPFHEGVVYGNGTLNCDGTPREMTYSNTESEPVRDEHANDGHGFCSVCGAVLTDYKELADGYYELGSKDDVVWFAAMVNEVDPALNAKLTADLDFEGTGTRIGTPSNRYCGTFDGQGHVISNYVVESEQEFQGLFGVVTGGANISNLVLDNTCSITAAGRAALIGGSQGAGDIYLTRLGFEGTATATTGANAAGIIGTNNNSEAVFHIDACYSTGMITGVKENAQISGWTGEFSLISNSWSISEVTNPQEGREFSRYKGNNHDGQYVNCFTTYHETNGGLNYDTPLEAFASGEVCYRLNAEAGRVVFYQNLGEDGDAYPVLDATHGIVYLDGDTYTNTKPAVELLPFAGHEIAEGCDWYLYNAATGKWLGNNNHQPGHWTTRAQVNEVGLDWTLTPLEDGWKMDAKFNGNGSMNGDGHGADGYLDTPEAVTKWTFTKVDYEGADVVYKITAGNTKLGVDGEGNLSYGADGRNAWVLVTKAERIAWMMANASEENPVDASFLIPNYDFSNANSRDAAWVRESEGNGSAWNNGGYALGQRNRVWEAWGLRSMDVHADMEVPNGKYLVIGQAAYVPTDNAGTNLDDYYDYVERGDATVYGLVYANGVEGKMASAYSVMTDARTNDYYTKELDETHWMSQGVNEYNHHLCEGRFNAEPLVVNVYDGKLRIGYALAADAPETSWVMITGARLQYIGEADPLPVVAELPFDYEYNADQTMVTFTVQPTTEGSTIMWFYDDDEEPMGMLEPGETSFTIAAAPDQVGVDGVAHFVVYIREYVMTEEEMKLVAENGTEVDLLMPKPEVVINVAYNEDISVAVVTAEPTAEGTSLVISIDNGEEFMELPEEGYTLTWMEALADEWGICTYNVIVREVRYDDEWNMEVVAEGFEQVKLAKPTAMPELVVNVTYSEDKSTAKVYVQPTQEGTSIIYFLNGSEEVDGMIEEGKTYFELAYTPGVAQDGKCVFNVLVQEVSFDAEYNMTVVAEATVVVTLEEPSAINGILAGKSGEKIFTIGGQHVGKVQRGVNIINGKKVVVK